MLKMLKGSAAEMLKVRARDGQTHRWKASVVIATDFSFCAFKPFSLFDAGIC